MIWRIAGALLFLVPLGTGADDDAPRPDAPLQPPEAVQPAVAPTPGPDVALAPTGVIEGVLRVRPLPPRRTASRYPGGGGAARALQEIPPVVYLKEAGSVGAAPVTSPEMAQQDTAFLPSLLVVPTGATVRFPNRDPFFHNVFSYSSAGRFDLGRYARGESKDVRFDDPGLVKVYCEVHEAMRAAVLVVENPFWARPDEEGRETPPTTSFRCSSGGSTDGLKRGSPSSDTPTEAPAGPFLPHGSPGVHNTRQRFYAGVPRPGARVRRPLRQRGGAHGHPGW